MFKVRLSLFNLLVPYFVNALRLRNAYKNCNYYYYYNKYEK